MTLDRIQHQKELSAAPIERSQNDVEVDGESTSPDFKASLHPELPSRKRARPTKVNASSSLSGTPLTSGFQSQSSVF